MFGSCTVVHGQPDLAVFLEIFSSAIQNAFFSSDRCDNFISPLFFYLTGPWLPTYCERACNEQDLQNHQRPFLKLQDRRLVCVVPRETGSFPRQFQCCDAQECHLNNKLHKLPCCVSSILQTSQITLHQSTQILSKDNGRMSLFTFCSVSGMNKALPKISVDRRDEISHVLLGYLTKSAGVVTEPGRAATMNCTMWLFVWACPWAWNFDKYWNGIEKKTDNGLVSCVSMKKHFLPNGLHANVCLLASVCRQGIQSDAQWLEVNLGGFVENIKYTELKVFNLSVVSTNFPTNHSW